MPVTPVDHCRPATHRRRLCGVASDPPSDRRGAGGLVCGLKRLPSPGHMENVWDYPRPPALAAGLETACGSSSAASPSPRPTPAWRVLETSHPPVYYLPRAAFVEGTLEPASGGSFCEWKGEAVYWHILAGGKRARQAAWSYPNPVPDLRGHPRPSGSLCRDDGGSASSATRLSRRSRAGSTAVGSPGIWWVPSKAFLAAWAGKRCTVSRPTAAAVVIGASGGVGGALVSQLHDDRRLRL